MSERPSVNAVIAEETNNWCQGEKVYVEALLSRHPHLASDAEAVLELICWERMLREADGDGPLLAEYVSRFPSLEKQLFIQFEIEMALGLSGATSIRENDSYGPETRDGRRRYWVYRSLRPGGQGAVYAAWDWKTSRFVALKFVRPGIFRSNNGSASPRISMGQNTLSVEARRAGEASGARNVITVYEFIDEEAEAPYLVMEYAAGGELADRVGSRKPSVKDLVRWLRQVADALDALHQATPKKVHSDVKPQNILLVPARPSIKDADGDEAPAFPDARTFGDEQLDAKLADFGLAGQAGKLRGLTEYYAAPEAVALGEGPSPAGDVYSLGVTACELLTGCVTAAAARRDGVGEMNASRTLALPNKADLAKLPGVGKDLAEVIAKAVSAAPESRYPTAREMGEDLSRVLLDEPVSARQEGALEAVVRWRRKNPGGARLAIFATALLASLAVASAAWWIESAERTIAQHGNARQLQDASVTQARFGDIGYGVLLAGHSLDHAPGRGENQDATRVWISLLRQRLAPLQFVHRLDGEIRGAAVHPSGDFAIAGTTKGKLWFVDLATPGMLIDPATGNPKCITIPGNDRDTAITSVSFHPEGRRFAVATADDRIHVFQTETGHEPFSFRHPGRPMSVAYSRDGVLAVAGTKQGNREERLITYDGRDGRRLCVFPISEDLYAADFSPDGRLIACCGEVNPSPRVSLFRANDPSAAPIIFPHTTRVFSIAFSPDNKMLATASVDGAVRFWDLEGRKEIHTPIQLKKQARLIAFSPDGSYLLVGSEDRTARVWEFDANRPLRPLGQTLYHLGDPRYGFVVPKKGRVMTTDLTGDIRVWGLPSRDHPITLSHPGPVWDAEFSPDGRRVLTGCLNGPRSPGAGRVWNLETKKATVLAHGADTQVVRFRPGDPETAITGGNDKQVKIWSVGSGKVTRTLAHRSYILSGNFTPDGRYLVYSGRADRGDQFGVWDFQQNRAPKVTLPVGPTDFVFSHIWSVTTATGGRLMSDGGPEARVWDTRDWTMWGSVWHTAPLPKYEPGAKPKRDPRNDSCGVLSKDGRLAAVWGRQLNEVVIWNLRERAPIRLEDAGGSHEGEIVAAEFSPTKAILATASADGMVKLWPIDKPGAKKSLPHESAVESLAFSPDGKLLATGTRDGLVRTWSVVTGDWTGGLWVHEGAVGRVAFSPDGQKVITASRDGTARVCVTPERERAKDIPKLLKSLEAEAGIAVSIPKTGTPASFSLPRPLTEEQWRKSPDQAAR